MYAWTICLVVATAMVSCKSAASEGGRGETVVPGESVAAEGAPTPGETAAEEAAPGEESASEDATVAPSAEVSEFSMVLKAEFREHSKDSSHSRYEVTISDNRVQYSGPTTYKGRGRYEHGTVTFELTAGQREGLTEHLVSNDLLQSLERVADTSPSMGFYRTADIDVTIVMGKARHVLRIQGVTSPRDSKVVLDPIAVSVARDVQGLARHLRELATGG